MSNVDVDKIIEHYMPEISKYKNPDALIHVRPDDYPKAIDILVERTIEENRKRYTKEQRLMIRFIEFYSLVAHGLGLRKTGGFVHNHPFSVAKDVFETGEEVFEGGEKYINVMAAKAHDVVEDRVHEMMEIIRKKDETHDTEWKDLPPETQQRYTTKAQKYREMHLWKLWWSLNEFVKKYLNSSKKFIKDAATFAAILEVLSKFEYKDYFDYFGRLLSLPKENKQIKFYKDIGFKHRLIYRKGFDEKFKKVKEALLNNKEELARELFVELHEDTLLAKLNSEINYFKNNVTYPALRIKLKDRKHNTPTVYAKEKGFESFSLSKQNYNIFKNIQIISTTKANLKAKSRYFKMEYEELPEFKYYEDLLDTTIRQLENMRAGIFKDHWYRLAPKMFHYPIALRVYDEYFGFEGKTKTGETKIPWLLRIFLAVPVKSFDGTVARYAGLIHRLMPEPKQEEVPITRIYKDVLVFSYVARKLKHQRAYSPYFGFRREEAIDFLKKGEDEQNKGSGIFKMISTILS